MKLKITEFITLIFLLLVTGLFWGTWFAMTRSIEAFTAAEFIKIGKVIILNVATPMRIIFPGSLLLIVMSVFLSTEKRSISFYLKILALLLMIVTLLITLLVEVPIDNELKNWTIDSVPDDWEAIRLRWKFYHMLRTFSSLTGFMSYVASAIFNRIEQRLFSFNL